MHLLWAMRLPTPGAARNVLRQSGQLQLHIQHRACLCGCALLHASDPVFDHRLHTYAGVMREQQLQREKEQTIQNIKSKDGNEAVKDCHGFFVVNEPVDADEQGACNDQGFTKRRNRWDALGPSRFTLFTFNFHVVLSRENTNIICTISLCCALLCGAMYLAYMHVFTILCFSEQPKSWGQHTAEADKLSARWDKTPAVVENTPSRSHYPQFKNSSLRIKS